MPPKPKQRPQVVGSPALDKYIEHARKGDYQALAVLYGQCSAFLGADGPVPEPLQSFMRERLMAISQHLSTESPDYRRGALKAIAGHTRRGVKVHASPLLPYSTAELLMAAEVYFLKRVPESSPVNTVADKYCVSPKVVEAAITTVRKAGVTWLD